MAVAVSRPELVAQLRGQHLVVPNISTALHNWPVRTNPLLEQVRALMPPRIQSYYFLAPSPSKVKKVELTWCSMTECPRKQKLLQKVDGGLFSATWWPSARIDRADILSCLALWLFIWDDEIDAEVASLSQDFEAAQAFRRETIAWVKYCLKVSDETDNVPEPANPIIAFFKILADAAIGVYDLEHRLVLFDEVEKFIQATGTEQAQRLSPFLPTVEDYATNRIHTSAVNIICFFIEYGCDIMLPAEVLIDPDMRVIWNSTNRIVWTHNDLFSLKKEVAQDTVDSLVPLLFHEKGSLDRAVAAVIGITETAMADLEASERVLVAKHWGNLKLQHDLQKYIDGCKYICTGNLAWSLQTKRYGIGDYINSDCLRIRL